MSNNNNRSNTRNTSNARTTGPSSTNNQPSPSLTHVWVARPSFTMGFCRVYFTKEDAFKDFGRDESLWTVREDYNIDHDIDTEVWTIDKSPVWDAEYEVSWELEKLEVRPRTILQTRTTTPPVSAPVVKTPVVKVETPEVKPTEESKDETP